jgi:hypothetical protein
MSKQGMSGLTVPVCAALCLGLLSTGCSDRQPGKAQPTEAELEKMADCLQTNESLHPGFRGIYLGHRFWVDKERSRETTVRAELIALGASLQDGKVVDAEGRELFFYEPYEYRHPRADPPEPSPNERGEKLSDKYHVVVMYGPKPKN